MTLRINILLSIIYIFLSLFSNLQASESNIKFRVHEHDNPTNGIECRISILDFNETEKVIDSTDENGNFEGNFTCKRGQKIKIIPVSLLYYPHFTRCPPENLSNPIKISKIKYIANLKENAKWLEKNNKLGDAALVNNEIYARVKNFDVSKADIARIKSIELLGKKLSVGAAVNFDFEQQKAVASPAMVGAIKKHQQSQNIEETGKLDYQTLRSVSSKDIGIFLYYAPPEEINF